MAHDLADSARISLLLRRAGFAARPSELDHYVKLGWDGTLNELLYPEMVQEDFDGLLSKLKGNLVDLQNIDDVQTWWLYRMVQTRRPLLEKLALFWHGHFAVANYKVNNPLLMQQHIDLLRNNAMATFDDLLVKVARDPAMLIWLDGASNHRNAPNENFGRELLELYTLGIGNYSEDDVKAAARAFTGWNLRGTDFVFDENQHDAGDKTFLGQSGNLDGTDIIANVVSQPATARRLVGKLFAFFAYPNPEPEVLAPLVDVYANGGHDIAQVVEAILRSDAFVSDRSRFEHVKSPVEYVVGSVRMLDATVRERDLIPVLRVLGQEILNPPNVAGWPGGMSWINPSTLLSRWNFAMRLTSARGQTGDGGEVKAASLLGLSGPPDLKNPDQLLDGVLGKLGALGLSPEAHQALVDYVKLPLDYPPGFNGQPNPTQQQAAADARLRGLMLLTLASPDYQVG